MNNTIAIKADTELLTRARIDLTASGYTDDTGWNNLQQVRPFFKFLVIDSNNVIALFNNVYKADKTIRMNHTNYTEIINQLKQRLCTPSQSR